jgi:hypothetical protein
MYTLYNVNVERHVKQYFSNNVEIPFISIGIGGKKNPFTSGETNDLLISLQTIKHKQTTLCGVGQPGPGFGHAQKCGEVKPVHGNLV